jgi:hypothetical protein
MRLGASAVATGRAFGNLGAVLSGQPEKRVDVTAPVSFGNFLGEAKPIGASGDFKKDVMDAIGVGVEAASFIPFFKGAKGVVQATKAGRALMGAKEGFKAGAVGGTLAGSGFEMQDEDATVGSVARAGVIGGVLGAPLGTMIGGFSGMVGKTVGGCCY